MQFFDEDFYLLLYPEVRGITPLPLVHYAAQGWKLGYNPSPLFNTIYYLGKHAEAVKSAHSPLEDFLAKGADLSECFPAGCDLVLASETLKGHIRSGCYYLAQKAGLIDEIYYRDNNPDVCDYPSPFAHFMAHGCQEGRNPSSYLNLAAYQSSFNQSRTQDDIMHMVLGENNSIDLYIGLASGELKKEATDCRVFDAGYYQEIYLQDCSDNADLFLHYMLLGWRLKLNPSSNFNTAAYAKKYSGCDINPVYHYLRRNHGANLATICVDTEQEGDAVLYNCLKDGLFDEQWYATQYPDIAQSALSARDHFRKYGFRENRQPGPGVDCETYLRKYLNGDRSRSALTHYFNEGKRAGFKIMIDPINLALIEEVAILHERLMGAGYGL